MSQNKSNKKASGKGSFFNKKMFRYGGYSIALIAGIIVVVILLNLGISTLESYFNLKADMTANSIYSVANQTKEITGSLEEEIEIYTLYQLGSEDQYVSEIVRQVAATSNKISWENVDPLRNPTFVNQFIDSTNTSIDDGSIIVTNKAHDNYRVLGFTDQYVVEYDEEYNPSVTQIQAEGKIVSAIMNITSGDKANAYFLQGHGEVNSSSSASLRSALEDENYNVSDFTIISGQELGQGDILVILSPQTDINEDERERIKSFLENGGRMFVALSPSQKLPMLESVIEYLGINVEHDLALEADKEYYVVPYSNYLVPNLSDHSITTAVKGQGLSVVVPNSSVLRLPDVAPATSLTITSLMATSSASWIDTNGDMEKSDGEEIGPFTIAAAVEDSAYTDDDETDDMRVLVFDNSDWAVNANLLSSYGNQDLFLNCMSWLKGAEGDLYVRGKMFSQPVIYLTSGAQAITTIIITWPLLSLVILAVGLVIYIKRKNL